MSVVLSLVEPLYTTFRLPLIALGLFAASRLWIKLPARDELKDEPPYVPYWMPR